MRGWGVASRGGGAYVFRRRLSRRSPVGPMSPVCQAIAMEAGVVIDRFSELGVWERAGVRAPYKPLLLLHALARYQAGGERLISFADLDERMQGIFRAFGPPRRRYGTNYPFWYLQTDGVWEVESADELRMRKGKSLAGAGSVVTTEAGAPPPA
jgi:predicted restriction endonuclease